jgi:cellulose synthase/poly-beta-1,6-N-acetylglucosamine synthase-like glycosyltransferase
MAVDLLWTTLTVLALLSLIPSIASLIQGVRLRGHVRRAMRLAFGAYLPSVALILPVRGLDDGFDANLRAIFSQTYPRFRVLVVADDPADPAVLRAHEIGKEFPRVGLSIIISEPNALPGKVNAVRSALSHLTPEDEAVVFADSDIRPATDWLRQLVQPLADSTVGVSTGFRWYIPPDPTFWSLVRAEWNAVSANVLFDRRRAFAWGGSCAVRQDTLPRLRLEERWRGVLSDDLVLTQAVRDAGLVVAYAPASLVPTFEGADRVSCIEWCFRQMVMATLYLPIVRRYAVAAFSIFTGSILFALLCLAAVPLGGSAYVVPGFLFLANLPMGLIKGSLRRRALFSAAPSVARAWQVPGWRSVIATLAVPWVMAAGLLRTRRPVVIRWRGRSYDVTDPNRVRLVGPK